MEHLTLLNLKLLKKLINIYISPNEYIQQHNPIHNCINMRNNLHLKTYKPYYNYIEKNLPYLSKSIYKS